MLDLNPIKERLKSALNGAPLPWQEVAESGDWWIQAANDAVVMETNGIDQDFVEYLENAPADISALIAEVERLRGLLPADNKANP